MTSPFVGRAAADALSESGLAEQRSLIEIVPSARYEFNPIASKSFGSIKLRKAVVEQPQHAAA
jgi:hypothetical protein